MAAVTFNPLVLSAKASVRGAAVRRAGAKASKRAAFAVKASDDDMDFMVRAARLFFDFHDGARIDGSRRRATRHRGERGRARDARRAMPKRAPRSARRRARRDRSVARSHRPVDGRSDGSRTSETNVLSKFFRRSMYTALTQSSLFPEHQGEIGLGEEMEDMLAKAAGGSSVPKFIKDTGNESLIQAFKFLGSDQMTGQGSELLFVEKYGETLYREAGFTETAEKINGRLAQVGFVLALQNTFNGDVLTLMAKYPLLVSLVVIGIAGASLVPTANPQGYFPDALKGSVMKAYESAGLNDVFSEKAELINGRAAMLGMGIFIATATIF